MNLDESTFGIQPLLYHIVNINNTYDIVCFDGIVNIDRGRRWMGDVEGSREEGGLVMGHGSRARLPKFCANRRNENYLYISNTKLFFCIQKKEWWLTIVNEVLRLRVKR